MMIRNSCAFLPILVTLTACSGEAAAPVDRAAALTVPGAPPGGAVDAAAKNAPASDVRESNALIEFSYRYPREAARIPELAAWLDTDRATKRDSLVVAAERDRSAAAKEGFPYHPHSHLQTWLRITDTPRFLSLSSEIETYMGGAHGMTSFDTLIWDRARAMRLAPLDLFVSGEAFDAGVRPSFCEGIDRAKAARGVAPPDAPGGPFSECPPASAQTIWLGSSDGRYLDRLTIAIAPYEIGPFAEGSYKINLPITSALLEAVRPQYARDFLPID